MATLINGYAYDLRVSALNAHVKWHQQLKKTKPTPRTIMIDMLSDAK